MEFYNERIQISKKVIEDVFSNFTSNTKYLDWGMTLKCGIMEIKILIL